MFSRRLLVLLAAAAIVAVQATPADEVPRAVVGAAVRAVEGDSGPRVRTRWEARLRRDPADRAAVLGLASLAMLSYDYPLAERLGRPLETGPADAYTLYLMLGQVGAAHGRGEFLASVPLNERALGLARTLRHARGEANALLLLSIARSALGDPTTGAALLDSMAPLLPADDLELRSLYHARRAWHLARFGPGSPDAEVRTCLDLARRAQAPRAEATCEFSAFLAQMRAGRLDSSMAALERAEQLDRRARNLHYLSRSLAQQASMLLAIRELGAVQAPLRESIELATRSHRIPVYQLSDMADVAFMARDYAQARDYATRAVALMDSLGLAEGAANARGSLARIARAEGDLGEARRLLGEQLAWAERAGYLGPAINARIDLANIAIQAGDLDAAQREITAAHAAERDVSAMNTGLDVDVTIALRRGDWATAERILLMAVERLDPTQYAMRYQFRTQLARVRAMQGRPDDAVRELQQAADEFDGWRATLDDASLRELAFQLNDNPDPDFGFAATLAGVVRGGGPASTVFELAERRRARELADRLVRVVALGRDDATAADTAARPRPAALTAAQAAAALPPRSALLEFVVAPGAPTTLFIVTAAGAQARVLAPIDSLAPRLERFAALLESGTMPTQLARELGAALFDSAVAALGPDVTRLVVVPDGPLHRLAYDALRLADERYVAERFAVSVAPSAAVAVELWRRPRALAASATPARILAFGDPAFARDAGGADSERFRSAFAAAGGLPRLLASGREAREVARYADRAEVRLRDRASEAFLKQASLDGLDVLHLATHALVDEQSVARTAVALAPGDGEDGFLTPGELAALPLGADLVVLSACGSAGGRVVAGEGVQGLTGSLLAAGARAIVATQWRIGDQATVPLVDAFYGALARGSSVGDALQAAKLDAIARGAPPSEWAAFTVVGDPTVTVALQQPAAPRAWWLVALAGTTALAAATFVGRRGRRRE